MKARIDRRILWDPDIEGSIQVHLEWRHEIKHWVVWDTGINVHMLMLWIALYSLRAGNISAGGFLKFHFLDMVKMDGIHPSYLRWYSPMVSTHGFILHFSGETNKIRFLESLSSL